MPNTERWAELYLNFVDQQSWLEVAFNTMTLAEFLELVSYVIAELNLYSEAGGGGEFYRVKGLLIAIARRELELAHFVQGLSDDQRKASIRCADAYYELAKGFYEPHRVAAVEAAWAATKERCESFGWPSPVFEVLPPQKLFLDA